MKSITHLYSYSNNTRKDMQINVNVGARAEYVMNFDGCSKGNPGPAGAGAVIYQNGIEIWGACDFVGNKETNNMAEYAGLILGMKEASHRNIRKIAIKGDSLLVIKQMRGEYKVKSENLLESFTQAKKLEKDFEVITYDHVYRTENKRADELSNDGLIKNKNLPV